MNNGENGKRISLRIKTPSAKLVNFIEKALQDDKFFETAVENPLEVLKENGVKLNIESLTPGDLATFFGALAGAKELIKKKQIKDIKFENIFGRAAEIHESTIMAETDKGMWTQFNRDAIMDKRMFSSVKVNFRILQETDIKFSRLADLKLITNVDKGIERLIDVQREISFAGETEQSRSTDTGVTWHFDHTKGMGSSTSSSVDTYRNKNFSGLGRSQERILIEDILNGPLINPTDLVNIAARINAYVDIVEQMQED